MKNVECWMLNVEWKMLFRTTCHSCERRNPLIRMCSETNFRLYVVQWFRRVKNVKQSRDPQSLWRKNAKNIPNKQKSATISEICRIKTLNKTISNNPRNLREQNHKMRLNNYPYKCYFIDFQLYKLSTK